jgi:hypothetical protein
MTHYQMLRRIDTKLLLAKGTLGTISCFGFRFGENHMGEKALLFQIVLKNAKESSLFECTQAIQNFLREHLVLPVELSWYFNWRSESEMRQMAAKYPANNLNVQGWGWEDIHKLTDSGALAGMIEGSRA